jgi:hypothetical protein
VHPAVHALLHERQHLEQALGLLGLAVTAKAAKPVGCANSVSRGEAVFVDESAEAVAALDVGR